MSARDEIWAFALTAHDYWPLLCSDEEPQEVAELTDQDREAFNAARREVQRRLESLVRCVWTTLNDRAHGTALHECFATRPHQGTIRGNKLKAKLPDNKGVFYVTLDPNESGGVYLSASLGVAKKRFASARSVWKDAHVDPQDFIYVSRRVEPGEAEDNTAAAFVVKFWDMLAAWVKYAEKEDEESGGDA